MVAADTATIRASSGRNVEATDDRNKLRGASANGVTTRPIRKIGLIMHDREIMSNNTTFFTTASLLAQYGNGEINGHDERSGVLRWPCNAATRERFSR